MGRLFPGGRVFPDHVLSLKNREIRTRLVREIVYQMLCDWLLMVTVDASRLSDGVHSPKRHAKHIPRRFYYDITLTMLLSKIVHSMPKLRELGHYKTKTLFRSNDLAFLNKHRVL